MAENTPESDVGSIECFQNYTAPEVFIQGLAGIVDQQDVESMIRAQKQMLQRFEKTNEMLTNCNALSVNRLKSAGAEFKRHTQLLLDTKKDLDNIFKRIRMLKSKLSAQYPQAFAAAALERDHSVAETEDRSKPGLSRPKSCIEPSSSSLPPSDVAKTRPRSGVELAAGRNLDIREGDDEQSPVKRRNSSSTDSQNGNSNNDTSPCTSDTG